MGGQLIHKVNGFLFVIAVMGWVTVWILSPIEVPTTHTRYISDISDIPDNPDNPDNPSIKLYLAMLGTGATLRLTWTGVSRTMSTPLTSPSSSTPSPL